MSGAFMPLRSGRYGSGPHPSASDVSKQGRQPQAPHLVYDRPPVLVLKADDIVQLWRGSLEHGALLERVDAVAPPCGNAERLSRLHVVRHQVARVVLQVE